VQLVDESIYGRFFILKRRREGARLLSMFENLGKALVLIRETRGLTQAQLARRAKMGKSQLSKYESGRILPKLDSLGGILKALNIGPFQFWYSFHLVDMAARNVDITEQMRVQNLPPLILDSPGLLSSETDSAFQNLLGGVMNFYHSVMVERINEKKS
jgi:transcriptional regulator with XRE-family HTH domain